VKKILWPGIIFVLVGALVAVDVTMLVVAARLEDGPPVVTDADDRAQDPGAPVQTPQAPAPGGVGPTEEGTTGRGAAPTDAPGRTEDPGAPVQTPQAAAPGGAEPTENGPTGRGVDDENENAGADAGAASDVALRPPIPVPSPRLRGEGRVRGSSPEAHDHPLTTASEKASGWRFVPTRGRIDDRGTPHPNPLPASGERGPEEARRGPEEARPHACDRNAGTNADTNADTDTDTNTGAAAARQSPSPSHHSRSGEQEAGRHRAMLPAPCSPAAP
jgi:hypothetical protein